MIIKYLIDSILSPEITALAFVDKYASIVRTLNIAVEDQSEKGKIKRYPVACDVLNGDCANTGLYNDLVPDDTKKSVIYWEMMQPMTNAGFTRTNDFYNKRFKGSARLVVWLNLAKLGITECNGAIYAIPILNKILTKKLKITSGTFDGSHVWIEPKNYVKQDINTIFGGYDYPKLKNYYLYPFDFFAIDVNFTIEQCLIKGGTFPSLTAVDCVNEIAPVVECKSLDFDGVNERLISAAEPSLNIEWSVPFSLEMWVKLDSALTSYTTLATTRTGNGFLVRRQASTGRIYFELWGSTGTETRVYSNGAFPLGSWVHLALTSDGSGLQSGLEIYINDVLQSKGNLGANNISTGTMTNASTTLKLMNYTSQYADGKLRNFRMWQNRVLSAGNVNALYHGGKYRPTEPHASDLTLKLDFAAAVWNGSAFDIADETATTAGVTSENMEEIDLINDCPE